MTSTAELYWAAGFLDGEGCFTTTGRSIVVKAAQKHRWPLDKLHSMLGGVVKFRDVNGKSGTSIWEWHLNSSAAMGLMMTLYKLMSPRRQGRIKELIDRWKARPTVHRLKTQCPRGHLYAGDNLAFHITGGKYRQRRCRACDRARGAAWRARAKGGH